MLVNIKRKIKHLLSHKSKIKHLKSKRYFYFLLNENKLEIKVLFLRKFKKQKKLKNKTFNF